MEIKGRRLRVALRLSDRDDDLNASLLLFDEGLAEAGENNGGSGNSIRMSRTLPRSGRFYLALQGAKRDAPEPNVEHPYSLEFSVSIDEKSRREDSIKALMHVTPARVARLLPENI